MKRKIIFQLTSVLAAFVLILLKEPIIDLFGKDIGTIVYSIMTLAIFFGFYCYQTKNKSREKFHYRLTEALRIRNMKLVELAEKSGIKESDLSQYLSGKRKPRLSDICSLSKVLNVSETWLMGSDVLMEEES